MPADVAQGSASDSTERDVTATQPTPAPCGQKGGEKILKRAALMSQEIEHQLHFLQERTARLRSAGAGA